ncbi:MAG: YlbF family regulator [Anaerolineales bacterium]|nr:YlbF family regulator [Anaerolineales bacterium]
MNAELLKTAQQLGQIFHQSKAVQTYLKAASALEDDPELSQREAHLLAMYQALAARQHAGEDLSHQEIQDFYTLRDEVQKNPLIRARDNTLGAVKSMFSAAGTEISNQLGVDFPSLALATFSDETESA